MYAGSDYTVTPRPMYPADGRKVPDIWTHPPELRASLQGQLGTFPLFEFWGPRAGISASKWIASAAIDVWYRNQPTLAFVYLPHLDYVLQKEGPSGPSVAREVRAIDTVCADLIDVARKTDARVIVLSEYGITQVSGPVHINRVLREAGLITVRDELGRELLDAGACEAFAVADHQIAHVYVKRRERIAEVRALLAGIPGVDQVLDEPGKRDVGLDHERSGELVAVAAADRWFTYYYWLDDDRAPDFARTVDIHRKPGYDPVELFLATSPAYVAWKLAQRKLGLRALLDVIPLDASLVKGSHGRLPAHADQGPVIIADALPDGPVHATAVKQLVLDAVFG
jgi:predicted AlkP superfamily pyrophosphatase or phosphodiesterase